MRLYIVRPGVSLEQPDPRLAKPIARSAHLVFLDTVVLGTKGYEILDRRDIATLHEPAKELPALREAQRVDGWRSGDDGMGGEGVANLSELFGQIADEGCGSVGAGVVIEVDVVYDGVWVCFDGEFAYGVEAISCVVVA